MATAIGDITDITSLVAEGASEAVQSTEVLKELAENLTLVVEKYRTVETNDVE